jgi:hypothetical protein
LLSKAKNLIGQRYVLNGGPYYLQEAVDALRKSSPERRNISAKYQPGDYFRQSQGFTHDGSKVIRDLGLQYTFFDKVVLDTVSHQAFILTFWTKLSLYWGINVRNIIPLPAVKDG